MKQVAPLITLDLSIKDPGKDENIEHVLLQTDPVNLSHITQQLEEALQEGYSQHIRRLSRAIKWWHCNIIIFYVIKYINYIHTIYLSHFF